MSSVVSVVQYQPPKLGNVLQQTNGRDVLVLRKPPKDILITNPAKKKDKSVKDNVSPNPPPVAVARRNARERNRVKQVNNGFATLRQHIPNSIAAAFESNNGRGGNKKLSKVETLRMAVEYIRSLEDILASDDYTTTSTSLGLSSQTYTYSNDDDNLSTNSTPPPPTQYSRPTYQIITTNHYYDDTENLEPIDDSILSDPSLIDAEINLANQDLSLLSSMHTTSGSLSPEMYSEDSLSPLSNDRSDPNIFIPVFNHTTEDIKLRIAPELIIKTEPPVINLQDESELPIDSKDNMIEVMAWWEQQQTRS